MNAIETITTKLNEVFKPLDEKVLAASKKWARERQEAIWNFEKSDEYQELRGVKNTWKRYDRLFSIAGGKSWYQVFTSYIGEYLDDYMAKNCKSIAAKRNASIAAKLNKAGVTEVVSEEFSQTDNGFDGLFVVRYKQFQRRGIYQYSIFLQNLLCLQIRCLLHLCN